MICEYKVRQSKLIIHWRKTESISFYDFTSFWNEAEMISNQKLTALIFCFNLSRIEFGYDMDNRYG